MKYTIWSVVAYIIQKTDHIIHVTIWNGIKSIGYYFPSYIYNFPFLFLSLFLLVSRTTLRRRRLLLSSYLVSLVSYYHCSLFLPFLLFTVFFPATHTSTPSHPPLRSRSLCNRTVPHTSLISCFLYEFLHHAWNRWTVARTAIGLYMQSGHV